MWTRLRRATASASSRSRGARSVSPGRTTSRLRDTDWGGGEARIGKEEGRAIDPIAAQVAPVLEARWDELEGDAELEQLRLVALQLPLRRLASAAVVVRERLAQLGERDRLGRLE